MDKKDVDLSVTLGKLKLKNPVMSSSGTFGYGREFDDFIDLGKLGAVVVKSTSLEPRLGNFEHRFLEVEGCYFLNTVGLQNVGVESYIRDKLPYLQGIGTPVIVSLGCKTVGEFVKAIGILDKAKGAAGIELNLACGNVEKGGRKFCADPDTVFQVVTKSRNATDLTIIAKFGQSLTDIKTLARVCQEAGADAVRPGGAPIGIAVNINTRRSKLGKNLTAAVGGPWRKPIAVKNVWEIAQEVRIPVIGGGGISSAEDALEFIIAGATAVQIGHYNFIDPEVTIKTIEGIRKYMVNNHINTVREIIGSLVVN